MQAAIFADIIEVVCRQKLTAMHRTLGEILHRKARYYRRREEMERKMREEESRDLCGRLMWHADREYEARMSIVVEQQEMNLFNMLRPKVSQDGNQFCVLYGDDLQSGIAGFGDTIRLAIYDFNKQFDKKAKNAPQSTKESVENIA